MTALNEKKLAKGNEEQIERSLHGTARMSENKKEMSGNKSEMN